MAWGFADHAMRRSTPVSLVRRWDRYGSNPADGSFDQNAPIQMSTGLSKSEYSGFAPPYAVTHSLPHIICGYTLTQPHSWVIRGGVVVIHEVAKLRSNGMRHGGREPQPASARGLRTTKGVLLSFKRAVAINAREEKLAERGSLVRNVRCCYDGRF